MRVQRHCIVAAKQLSIVTAGLGTGTTSLRFRWLDVASKAGWAGVGQMPAKPSGLSSCGPMAACAQFKC